MARAKSFSNLDRGVTSLALVEDPFEDVRNPALQNLYALMCSGTVSDVPQLGIRTKEKMISILRSQGAAHLEDAPGRSLIISNINLSSFSPADVEPELRSISPSTTLYMCLHRISQGSVKTFRVFPSPDLSLEIEPGNVVARYPVGSRSSAVVMFKSTREAVRTLMVLQNSVRMMVVETFSGWAIGCYMILILSSRLVLNSFRYIHS